MYRLLDPTGRDAPVEDMLAFDAAITAGAAALTTPFLVSTSSVSANTHASTPEAATAATAAENAGADAAADEAIAAMLMSPPNIVRGGLLCSPPFSLYWQAHCDKQSGLRRRVLSLD